MNDIRSILDALNIEYKVEGEHHHCTSGFLQIPGCPFCDKNGSSYRMGIAVSGSHSSCWICGSHSIVSTIQELAGITYPEAKELLKDVRPERIERIERRGNLVLPKHIKPLSVLKAHRKYLKSRNFNWKKIERLWGVQGIGVAARLAWRLFIPITLKGEIVSWTTRTISDNPNVLRYISAPAEEEKINHKTLLYGEDLARHAVVIVEGPTDVWRIGPGAVAALGMEILQSQIHRMIRFPVRAVCLDNEPEAQKRAKKLLNQLSVFPGETFNIVLSSKDAGEASEKEIRRIRKEILE